eukprot:7205845-Pyramimonas_sp.AAC.1
MAPCFAYSAFSSGLNAAYAKDASCKSGRPDVPSVRSLMKARQAPPCPLMRLFGHSAATDEVVVFNAVFCAGRTKPLRNRVRLHAQPNQRPPDRCVAGLHGRRLAGRDRRYVKQFPDASSGNQTIWASSRVLADDGLAPIVLEVLAIVHDLRCQLRLPNQTEELEWVALVQFPEAVTHAPQLAQHQECARAQR